MKTSQMIATSRVVRNGAVAFTVVAALGIAPILTAGNIGGDQAFAHPGNGNGNGGGNGNGNGGGNGHAAVGASAGVGASEGPSGHEGSLASMLGGLNAAHASKTALSHANPRSRVGRIAAYSKAVSAAEQSVDTAAANLVPVHKRSFLIKSKRRRATFWSRESDFAMDVAAAEGAARVAGRKLN